MKSSEEYLLNEIDRLKQELTHHSIKLQLATELQTIDQNTLKTFQKKFTEISEVLHRVKQREKNAYHLIQVLSSLSLSVISHDDFSSIDPSSEYISSMEYLSISNWNGICS